MRPIVSETSDILSICFEFGYEVMALKLLRLTRHQIDGRSGSIWTASFYVVSVRRGEENQKSENLKQD